MMWVIWTAGVWHNGEQYPPLARISSIHNHSPLSELLRWCIWQLSEESLLAWGASRHRRYQCFLSFLKGGHVGALGCQHHFPFYVWYVLLTYFHKNASFLPNMLNYLNTTFTFGKQNKDNFINRKFQCRPANSFIHSFSCPFFLRCKSQGQ